MKMCPSEMPGDKEKTPTKPGGTPITMGKPISSPGAEGPDAGKNGLNMTAKDNDRTGMLTGPALIQAFRTGGFKSGEATMLGNVFDKAKAQGSVGGAPVNEVLPALTGILAQNTGNPAISKEIVSHFRSAAENTPGFADKPMTPQAVNDWYSLFNQDVKIHELFHEGQENGGMTPAQELEWRDLVAKRNAFMRSPMNSYGPIHMNYMQGDPISSAIPHDARLAHDNGIISVDPKNGYAMRAGTNLALGDPKAALADASRAISLNPNSAGPYLTKGAAQERLGDYAGAYDSAKKALELDPKDKGALALMKSVEGRSGSQGSGAAPGAAAGGSSGFASLGWAGGRGFAGMTSASALASGQKLDEARRALKLGDFQAAVALAKRALELNANNVAAYSFLSKAYAARGDYRNAIAMAKAGLAVSPHDADLLNARAFAENRSRLYRDALGSSTEAMEADPRNPESYANRAHAHGGLNDKDAMMADIRRAASMDPRYQASAAQAETLQLPMNADVLFLFPGEEAPDAASGAVPARARSFGAVAAAGILGGLLLAIGLLSTVLAPIKESVVSAFTKATRRGPSVSALEVEASSAEPAAPGLIRGQYEISRKIGEGGMGTVYEGTDRSLGRRVAIKKMRDELRLNPRDRARFIIEAKTVASLHHANIVDIYAIAEEGEDVYLVFEFVDGKTVHDLVQSQGRLSPADAARLTGAMSSALAYAHSKGVIHRDMKPSNVMLSKKGEVKVMDFGIARMAKDALTRYSMTNNVVGTPPYMAPEQEQGVVRKESDVYSLAICAYEMLTGKLPFIGIGAGMLMNKINMSYIPPARAIAGLPEALDEVFLKAFQADPELRYRTPQEFSAALDAALGGIRERA